MIGDVYADLAHGFDSLRAHKARLDAGALDLVPFTPVVPQ
jgi:hypothetical protein